MDRSLLLSETFSCLAFQDTADHQQPLGLQLAAGLMSTSCPFCLWHRTLCGPTDTEKSFQLFSSNKRRLAAKAKTRSLTALSHDGPPPASPSTDSSAFMCTALTCSDLPLMHDRDLQMQHDSPAVIIHWHRSFDAWKWARWRVSVGSSSWCNTFRAGISPRAPPPSPLCGRGSLQGVLVQEPPSEGGITAHPWGPCPPCLPPHTALAWGLTAAVQRDVCSTGHPTPKHCSESGKSRARQMNQTPEGMLRGTKHSRAPASWHDGLAILHPIISQVGGQLQQVTHCARFLTSPVPGNGLFFYYISNMTGN